MRIRDESISMERLDGETILINFDTGQYFSFHGPSADVIWLIERGVDRRSWLDVLAGAFSQFPTRETFHDQIDTFINDLLEAEIVEAGASLGELELELPDDYVRGVWTAPELTANQDLVDLLVIDPIHDTGDDGWPESRSP